MVDRRVLDTLIELSERRRDEAANEAADARRATEQVLATKQQLQQYRADYDARSPLRPGQQTGPQQIERHQRFVARLDVAIDDQARRHALMRRVQAQREADLVERQKRLKAFVPDYMVPKVIETVETIPLTSNGKVDRRRLGSGA